MFKLTIETPDVDLVSLLLTLNIFDMLLYCIFCYFENVNVGWNTLLAYLNLSMHLILKGRTALPP